MSSAPCFLVGQYEGYKKMLCIYVFEVAQMILKHVLTILLLYAASNSSQVRRSSSSLTRFHRGLTGVRIELKRRCGRNDSRSGIKFDPDHLDTPVIPMPKLDDDNGGFRTWIQHDLP